MSTQSGSKQSKPSPALLALGRALAGAWRLTGGATGLVRYEWASGGLFLIQHVDLLAFGRPVAGMEIIGHLQRVNESPTKEIWSRFYSFNDGLTLDYVYEIEGRQFTIWFMERSSNNRFVGLISEDGGSFAGAWSWPGGGYEVTAEKIS